jgi:AcrR family transcriptional regulator
MRRKSYKSLIETQPVRHAKSARAHISKPRPGRTRRDPAQERSRQTVDAIVEAAGQLLVEHGKIGVTTNAVAERAGVSIGSLYQYFLNKEAILAALQERHRDQVMPLIQHALARLADPGLDMVDGMVGLMRAMADLHEDAPERLRAISQELREEISGREMQSFTEATTKILAARFSRTEDSVRPVAWLACVTLGNLGRTLVHHPPALDVEQLLAALADMLRGLFARIQLR